MVVITIRRPAQLNAMTDMVNDEIMAVIRENVDDPSVAGFVITGYGTKAFCAGADIGKFTGDARRLRRLRAVLAASRPGSSSTWTR